MSTSHLVRQLWSALSIVFESVPGTIPRGPARRRARPGSAPRAAPTRPRAATPKAPRPPTRPPSLRQAEPSATSRSRYRQMCTRALCLKALRKESFLHTSRTLLNPIHVALTILQPSKIISQHRIVTLQFTAHCEFSKTDNSKSCSTSTNFKIETCIPQKIVEKFIYY